MIAVTGASGHLGQWVVARLTQLGFEVLCISRSPINFPRIPELVWERPVHTLVCDITDPVSVEACSQQLCEVETFVHLAGYVPDDTARNTPEDAASTLHANVLGSIHLLKALSNSTRLSSLVYASTFEVYGGPRRIPIDEDHPTQPFGYYGASKLAVEKFVSLFSLDRGVPACSLRFSAIYGPGDRLKRAIGNFVRAAASGEELVVQGDGFDLRELVYAGDAAEAVVLAIQKRPSCVINIASGIGYTINEIADTVLRVDDDKVRLVHRERVKERTDYVMTIDRARDLLDWRPSTSIEEGVRAQLGWVRACG
jgi:nucleoside-diphosphate-sugar epimerase